MSEYYRNCPACQEIIFYTTKNRKNASERKNSFCRKCLTKRNNDKCKNIFNTRNCPTCNKIMTYTHLSSYVQACELNTECKSCSKSGIKNCMSGKVGELSPFYGKKHSDELKEKFRRERTGKPIHTPESRKKISNFQKINPPMKGKTIFSVWVEKYGIDIANEKMKILKEKHRQNALGEKNNMFGKPSPTGSGNGYSGWYNNRFFRSLRELMFLIYAKRFNLKLESLEKNNFKLEYKDWEGQIRNYFSDYIVNDKFFLEIKPKKLWDSPKNKSKFQSAKKYCGEVGLKFKLMDPKINTKLITKLYLKGDIKFMKKYEERFLKYIN